MCHNVSVVTLAQMRRASQVTTGLNVLGSSIVPHDRDADGPGGGGGDGNTPRDSDHLELRHGIGESYDDLPGPMQSRYGK